MLHLNTNDIDGLGNTISYQKYFPCCFASKIFFPFKAFSNSAADVPTLPKTFSSCWALTTANVLPTRCWRMYCTIRATGAVSHKLGHSLDHRWSIPSPISGIMRESNVQNLQDHSDTRGFQDGTSISRGSVFKQ